MPQHVKIRNLANEHALHIERLVSSSQQKKNHQSKFTQLIPKGIQQVNIEGGSFYLQSMPVLDLYYTVEY